MVHSRSTLVHVSLRVASWTSCLASFEALSGTSSTSAEFLAEPRSRSSMVWRVMSGSLAGSVKVVPQPFMISVQWRSRMAGVHREPTSGVTLKKPLAMPSSPTYASVSLSGLGSFFTRVTRPREPSSISSGLSSAQSCAEQVVM
jgi:hypothetical protein